MTGPDVVAPVVTYLAGDGCPLSGHVLSGQVLPVRGTSIAANRGWSLGPRVERDEPWTVDALADALADALVGVEVVDPFGAVTTALGRARGLSRREDVEAVVTAQLI
ncbi:hypothetical protein [Lentzea sp. NBRC 102530]|uniref:hypothetical protein n=1 Tax=Lentzea sp. NBRC 102530 TaxID=3032201 RepID=UPI0024A576D2|nr:hypothetical protein [Lentzea sp. NBRC 102530]GLY54597.1 hypothetical protein Lesp01_82520 [Lentzea sp. NBRC 102530]